LQLPEDGRNAALGSGKCEVLGAQLGSSVGELLVEIMPIFPRRYFLPPIIFYAGLSVKKKKFFRNFASIATLGILGTYILFAVIALGLFAISKLPNLLNLTVHIVMLDNLSSC
jgi:NhaP-type Na+/H+ or K+/H+ antiporter